jgi:lipid-A-disaccharide synthase
MKFALIAGEASGDILGAALIRALAARYPDARFIGVTGPRMAAAGCEALESVEALSVMGLAEVVRELPRLFRLRRSLVQRLTEARPDCVIGIDAPDFNLGLERRLKAQGLRTVHLVSPTVWAWRPGRVRGIAESCDLMLTLYPFEEAFYRDQGVRVAYVGHPLADELQTVADTAASRRELGVDSGGPVVAVLPGSRGSEVAMLMPAFAQTAAWLHRRVPGVRFVLPVAKPSLRPQIEQALRRYAPEARWHQLDGGSREAMCAADVVLLASGTATLECLLLGRPMVVGYRVAALTATLVRGLGLLKIPRVSLPNLLCREPLVPEFLQEQVRAENLGPALYRLLRQPHLRAAQIAQFSEVAQTLRRGAGERAAEAISELVEGT